MRPHSKRPARRTDQPEVSRELVLVMGRQAEVVEAELVEDHPVPIQTDTEVIDRVLDALFSKDGARLVPPPLNEVVALHEDGGADPELAQRKARLLAVANEVIQDHAQSQETGKSYGSHLRAWRAWCAEVGVPALPFAPQWVVQHLAAFAFESDGAGEPVRDAAGELVAAVRPSSVSQRLAALNKAAEYLHLPKPGDNPGIQQFMTGLRRKLGAGRRHEKDALTLAMLERCLAATTGATLASARSRAAVLLRAHTKATAGQLQRLTWADIEAHGDTHIDHGPLPDRITLTLAKTHGHGKPTTVTIKAHEKEHLCLIATLRSLHQLARPTGGPVLAHADGTALSRQALHATVRQTVGDTAWDDVPALLDKNNRRKLSSMLDAHHPVAPLIQQRDRALLLTGFYTALRRSNLAGLRWEDLYDDDDAGVAINVYRTKTDPEGTRKTKWAPQARPGSTASCPATALRQWLVALTAALGRPPQPHEPVFASLHRSGAVKQDANGNVKGISGQDICDIVQELTFAAGLDARPTSKQRRTRPTTAGGSVSPELDSAAQAKPGRRRKNVHRRKFGAHSLRIGFVTESLTGDKLTISEVQAITDHKTVNVLMHYHRQLNDREKNPARTLMDLISGGVTEEE